MKKIFCKWFPPFLMFVVALLFFSELQPVKDKDFAYTDFGQLPVTANGRVQPMDSLARNALLQLREKQTLNLEPWKEWNEKPRIIPAIEWLANVMMNSAVADEWPVFRVDNQDLISLLKLPEKDPAKHADGKHYSWNQISPGFEELHRESQRIETNTVAQTRTAYEQAVMKMNQRVLLYAQLKNTVQPADVADWAATLEAYEKMIPAAVAAAKAQQAGETFDQQMFSQFAGFIQAFQFMASLEPPLILPPLESSGKWRRTGDALLEVPHGTPVDIAIRDYAKMASALAADKPDEFNAAVRDYRSAGAGPGEGAGQGPGGSVLQPDGAVLQCDGHLCPRRAAGDFFVV